MSTRWISLLASVVLLTALSRAVGAGPDPSAQNQTARQKPQVMLAKVPLSFEENRGQTDPEVRFLARSGGYTAFLTSTEAILVLKPLSPQGLSGTSALNPRGEGEAVQLRRKTGHVVRMRFVNGNPEPQVAGITPLRGVVNYFDRKDVSRWHTGIPTYAKVGYRNIYPGVDLVYYGSHRQLEFDLVLDAGADPDMIRLAFGGAERHRLDSEDNLILETRAGELRLLRPRIYQDIDGERREVSGGYVLLGDRIGVRVGAYDSTRRLVIDPVLSYATYLGATEAEGGSAIAVDGTGAAYVTGNTGSLTFPTTDGAFEGDATGNRVFVTKLNPAGSDVIYSTYLGDGEGHGIAVDAAGNAYITGVTGSANFPTTPGSFEPVFQGSNGDAFVTKLNSAGSGLVYSTYLGGLLDDSGNAIAIDGAGNAYVTGRTGSSDFPVTPGAYQTLKGFQDHAFVTKLNPTGSGLVYSTFLGGGGNDDFGNGIALDAAGNAYVTGEARSAAFPTTLGAFQRTLGGGPRDAFVAKLDATGSALVYSTYLGGTGGDNGSGIAVNADGNAYITGTTNSVDFPTERPIRGAVCPQFGDAFVTKISVDGTSLVYSTYLGGCAIDQGLGIAVDSAGNAYVIGFTFSDDFPTVDSLQVFQNSQDVFLAKLNAAGSSLEYSTYLGGQGGDIGFAIALDSAGSAYVTGGTSSADFPTTSGSLQPGFAGGTSDVFITKIEAGVPPPPPPPTVASTFGPPSSANPQGTFAEPINTGTGNYLFQRTDLAIPGRGLPLVFTRTYNSLDTYTRPLGLGWTHSYNLILSENVDGSVRIKLGDGREETYTPTVGGYTSPPGVFSTLVKNGDGTFTLTLKNQTGHLFSSAGRLQTISDRNGNALTLAYDSAGNLTTITDTVGRAVTLVYDGASRLSQLADPIGRVLLYGYDVAGNLASVTDPAGGVMTFAYDGSQRVTEIRDERGNQLLVNTHDGSGRAATQTNGRGFVTTFAYGVPVAGDTTITDPRGGRTVHTHDAQLRLVRVTDALGEVVEFGYDASNNRTNVKDQNGKITFFGYDGRGNVTSITDPLANVISFTYDSQNNLTSATNARGFTTLFGYTPPGNLTARGLSRLPGAVSSPDLKARPA